MVAPWAVWAIARTAGLDRAHPFVAFAAFTPYAAATAPFALLVALVLRQRVVALIALVTVVLFAIAVLPRVMGDDETTGSETVGTITVMTSNLFGGRGDAERIMELVRRYDVDVLALQELTPQALDRIEAAGGDEVFQGRAAEPRPGGAGNAILTRSPLRRVPSTEGWSLPHEPAVDIRVRERAIRVRVAHPTTPVGRAHTAEWQAYLRALPAPSEDGRALLLGDFNATLDHADFRRLLGRGWRDAGGAAGEGLRPTWPVGRRILGLTIDHVLFSERFALSDYQLREIPNSDHRAVIATLAVR